MINNLKQKILLSAVIVAHNEEGHIADCLERLKFADEIVVVLDKCTDKTKEIALKYTDKIIEGSWDIEGARRNVGLENCSGEWILELDADERVSDELAAEILLAIKSNSPCGFVVTMSNYVGNRLVQNGWLRALAVSERQTLNYKNLKKYHQDKKIHPTFDYQGEVKYLKNPLQHLMDDDIADMLNRFNRYTNWKSDDMISKGKIKGNCITNFFSFLHRFCKSFIFKKGYKEGGLGFLIAILCGLYPVVSYLKAMEKIRKN